ncbi:aldo/keto reductase [Lamprobacter modestohalophilus]|uniref:Aldo/keto reductase n=1 Tax=Lamprobacter modestohalophilus TaxID=1064514 RepID=A0A9X0WBB1_9GAMM|nr:aldo/keto reductase [Lamprobacter modestohalophilus]MBK1620274.1 aldo/keto reductase [Lamprobacter modestohalophilus]MCF7996377.1 aldo/keto reductase [Chromatiaceae bacterium]MCF8016988.1 aldo/keto reductase [Chromatiaceae bacterium]
MPQPTTSSLHPLIGQQPPSVLGLGLAALGRPGYINLGHGEDTGTGRSIEAMRERAFAVLDAARRAGIGYFDTARSYGRGEAFLGEWLRSREVPGDGVTIASKWGYTYTADWRIEAEQHEVKDHSLAVLQRQWQETHSKLGGYLDLYQIHSATLDSGVLNDRAVHAELARLKATGTRIGLTLSGPQQAVTLENALTLQVNGMRLFDAVQATWNLLERSAEVALDAAHRAGLTVIIKEALANGRLTARNQAATFQARRQRLETLAGRFNASVDAVALAAALARPWASVVLSGAATEAQLQSNLNAVAIAWDDEAEALIGALAEDPAAYWQTRAQMVWN